MTETPTGTQTHEFSGGTRTHILALVVMLAHLQVGRKTTRHPVGLKHMSVLKPEIRGTE